MSSENNEQKTESPVAYEPVLPSPLDSFAQSPTSSADDAAQPTPQATAPFAADDAPTQRADFRRPNAAAPQGRPTPPFPYPPRPLGFWGLLAKDATVAVVGVAAFCFLSFFLFFVLVVGFAGALSEATASSLVVEETLSGDDASLGKIVVLPIEGVIETEEYGFLREAIDLIAEDERVRGVVLRVNSPGGTIAGSDYYYTLLKELKEELDIPVIASMGDVAASGGYYVATAADQIYAERSTLTGSIGVIVSMYDASELCEKIGVASTPVVSGPMKGMGDFMKKPTPEETAVWQALVDESYEQFLDVVCDGRPWYRGDAPDGEESDAVPANREERRAELRRVADGRIYTAQQAKELHLIDEIGFLDDAIDAAIKAAGLTEETAQVVRFEEIEDWTTALGLSALTQTSEPLGEALDAVSTPQGYYILPRALPTSR